MGGPGSGRKPKPKVIRPDKHCKACGKRLSPGRNGRRDYCNDACKMKAYRRRQAEKIEA